MKKIDECCSILNEWAISQINRKGNFVYVGNPFTVVNGSSEIRFSYEKYPSPIVLANIAKDGGTMRMDTFLLEHIEWILLKYNIKYLSVKYKHYTDTYELRNNKYEIILPF